VEDSTLRQDRRVSGVICLECWGLFFALIILCAGMLRRRCALAVAMGGFFKRRGRPVWWPDYLRFQYARYQYDEVVVNQRLLFLAICAEHLHGSWATSGLFLEFFTLAVNSHAGLILEAKIRRPRRGEDGR
jgi:hypothetical protein